MKVGSLFAGIGGFDLGLEAGGMTVAWQVEKDRRAVSVLRNRFPGVPIYDDVERVHAETACPDGGCEECLETVDIVVGGFPCQDLSVAGRRRGLGGERSGLFFELLRIADEIEPRWLLVENVPGLLSNNGGRDFQTFLEFTTGSPIGLPADGGGWRNSGVAVGDRRWLVWRVLDAQFFGVPQRRTRVFIVGGPRDSARLDAQGERPSRVRAVPVEVLLEPEGLQGNPEPSREAGSRTAATLTRGADSKGRGGYAGRRREDDVNLAVAALSASEGGTDDNDARGGRVVPALLASLAKGPGHNRDEHVAVTFGFDIWNFAETGKVSKPVAGIGGGNTMPHVVNVERGLAPNGSLRARSVVPALSESERKGHTVLMPETAHALVAKEGATYTNEGSMFQLRNVVPAYLARAFKPSHYTRGKDGAPSEIAPPLSADADRGDQDTVLAFEPRYWTRGEGSGLVDEVVNPLDTTPRGDRAPVIFRKVHRAQNADDPETWDEAEAANTLNSHDDASDVRATHVVIRTHNLHDESKGDAWLAEVPGALQATGSTPNQFDAVFAFHSTAGSRDPQMTREGSPPLKVGSGLGIPSPPAVFAWDEYNAALTPELFHTLPAQGNRHATGGAVFALASRSRGGVKTPEWSEETAYALLSPGEGGRSDDGVVVEAVPRRLTPTECERLQGFPDGWTAEGLEPNEIDGGLHLARVELSDSARYRMLGNAVAVPCSYWIGLRILAVDAGLDLLANLDESDAGEV